ncbi:MAG: ATP-binding protein [Eubacteriales bacterium]
MKHNLNAIDTLLCNNGTAEALNFIRRLDRSLENTALKIYCENYFINVILSSYIKKAEDEHIEVRCEVAVPEKINIDPVEIGLIFANAIENAINACKKIEDADTRKLWVLCREQQGHLLIRISNPYAGEVKFDGEYPVAESPEHGAGTKSIATIVQKNGGIFSFTARNGIFDMTVSLNY